MRLLAARRILATQVDRVSVITTDLAEVVSEMGTITQTISPAVALNDQFRRRLEQLRSLGGSDEGATPPER